MNSVLDDLENVEDLHELESRLYGQIHHEAQTLDNILTPSDEKSKLPTQSIPFQQQRIVTNTSVRNNVETKLSNRYWNNSQNIQQVQRKKFPNNPKNGKEISKTDNNEIFLLKEKTFKPFKVYESIITNLIDKTDNNPVTQNELSDLSENPKQCVENEIDNCEMIEQTQSDVTETNLTSNSKKNINPRKRKQRNVQNQNNNKKINEKSSNLKLLVKRKEMNEQKNLKYKNIVGGDLEKEEPLVRNFLKMQRALKLQAKRTKAKMARQRNVKRSEKEKLITFDLITDDDDKNDDVIMIPVPPPPIVTINDSSDGEDEFNNEDTKSDISLLKNEVSFAKPKNVKILNKITSNINDNNSSRCASPSSVVSSDDFIGHADRSRLLQDRIIVNDDDLICMADNVETYIENQQKSNPNNEDDQYCNLTSQLNKNNTKKNSQQINEYCGTQDVYCESESDIPESISSNNIATREKTIQSNTTTKGSIIIEESPQTNSDCIEENNLTIQKIKRLRKRRASSSNKEIETNNDSTDSDRDELMISNQINTTLPFITRGEAVETSKIKQLKKRRTSQLNRVDINSSDNEFINMLHTFSQGQSNKKKIISLDELTDESTISEEEDLTARKIAEEILNKRNKKSKQSTIIEENSNDNSNTELPIAIEVFNIENACDLRTTDIELMKKQFNIIDKMANKEFNTDENVGDITGLNNIEKDTTNSSNIYNITNINSINNIGWNEEMFRFYNWSWGGENFNVNLIRKKMDRKARWTIYTEDRFPKFKRNTNIKCNNCSEFGHMQSKCTQPKKLLMCSMCGQIGHREPRCPNTICLRCGNKTRVFIKSCNACVSQNRLICPICKIRGHGIDLCPDKWRRYHSTIVNNAQPNSTILYSSKKYCCICAGSGHLSEHCKVAYRFSEYPPSVTEIKSHRKSYDDQRKPTTLLPNSYNLLYEPDDNINFSFSTNSKITTTQYYGRYLSAVGLNYIMSANEANKRKFSISVDNETEKLKEKNRKNKRKKIYKKTLENDWECKNLVRNPLATYEKSVINDETNSVDEISVRDCAAKLTTTTSTSNETGKLSTNSVFEHKFKSPNILVEKSTESHLEQSELNKCDDNSQVSKEGLNMDSDSNYSFSEHFDINIAASIPSRIDFLPDFIPLNNNDNIDDDNVVVNFENVNISKDINPNSDDDTTEFENTFQLSDIPCIAKIYLKKDFSDYLLSPEGNKFIVDNSNKFDVKASIDWTRVGNMLVLEGLRANQDKFHTELLLAFRSLPDKLNRKELESNQHQQVPRKRIKMIRFLIENLRILQNSSLSTDINLLFKQLKDYENKNSQTSWKMAEKTRRILNMTLFGKVGLRDGKRNLVLLINSLKSSLILDEEFISNDMREDIHKSWKYIFSSQKHENYEELVEIFYEMKRNNLLPKLKIDGRLIYRNFSSLTQKEKNEIINDGYYYYDSNEQQYNNSNNLNDSTGTSTAIPKLILDKSAPIISKDLSNISLNISDIKNCNKNQSFGEFLNENSRKLEWESQCVKLLQQIENCTKNSSIYWSKQSIKFINNCLFFYKSNQLLSVQLQRILQKANKGLLSYDDHREILKINNNIKISENIYPSSQHVTRLEMSYW